MYDAQYAFYIWGQFNYLKEFVRNKGEDGNANFCFNNNNTGSDKQKVLIYVCIQLKKK